MKLHKRSGTTSRARLLSALAVSGALAAHANAQVTWDGGGVAGGDVNWTTGANWDTNVAPGSGAFVTMAGTIDTTNTVNVNYDIFALIINNTAGAFTINGGAGVSLTTRGGGIINNDNQAQTINVPLIVNTGQTWAAQASPLVINGAVNLGANQLFFDSNIFLSTNSAINGTISGSEEGVREMLTLIEKDERFADLPVKYSTTDEHPFRRRESFPR